MYSLIAFPPGQFTREVFFDTWPVVGGHNQLADELVPCGRCLTCKFSPIVFREGTWRLPWRFSRWPWTRGGSFGSQAVSEASLEICRESLGGLWRLWGVLVGPCALLVASLGPPWSSLGPSWAILELSFAFWGYLGPSWQHLDLYCASWGPS